MTDIKEVQEIVIRAGIREEQLHMPYSNLFTRFMVAAITHFHFKQIRLNQEVQYSTGKGETAFKNLS